MADETVRINRVGLSGPEAMFFELADARGAVIEARIINKVKDWEETLYSFCITFPKGNKRTGLIPWDMSTFAKLADMIIEELGV